MLVACLGAAGGLSCRRAMRDADSQLVERTLCDAGCERVAAYRYNAASVRVRVVYRRFEGLSRPQRADLAEPAFARLPERLQREIVMCWFFTPGEAEYDAAFHDFGNLEGSDA